MGTFCIARKQFLDRVFDIEALAEMAEMLRHWYIIRAEAQGATGQIHFEARVYAFARSEGEVIRRSLAEKLPEASFDVSDPDELAVIGAAQSAIERPDVSIWREVLAEPLIQRACLFLRMTIRGPVVAMDGHTADGTSTFVFCGQPAGGAMLVKAIWKLGHDESMQLAYRHASWKEELKLLEVFDLYRGQCTISSSDSAARLAFASFTKECRHLFLTQRQERGVMRLIRHRTELPDDRGPLAFVRRLGLPLGAGVCLITLAIVYWRRPQIIIVCGIFGAYLLQSAGRIAWEKMQRVRRYYSAMRSGLGKHYSGPVDYRPMDLSSDKTPTLLKYCAELEALGARHICDVCITTARGVHDGNRIYAIGNARASVCLLRKLENHLLFPARPILFVSTGFKDGSRHYTVNCPRYRKRSLSEVTGRCLLHDEGINELLTLHNRHVDKLIAAGKVPIVPPNTSVEVLEWMHKEHEESRHGWQKSPYSWGDALHEAFKVCRREYRPD